MFTNLDEDWSSESGDLGEWNRLQDSALQGRSESHLVAFREALVYCTIGETPMRGGAAPEVALFTYLGSYNTHIRQLFEADLADYPTISRLVKRLDAGEQLDYESSKITRDEWVSMVDRYLVPLDDLQTFNFNGRFYGPEFGWDVTYMKGSIANLQTTLKIVGVVSLLLGFLLSRRLYFHKLGIMINPQGVAVLYDGIVLLFAVPAAYMAVSTLLAKTLFVTYFFNDDYAILMGNFFFYLGIPFVTLLTSRLTSQSINIDSTGIYVDDMNRKTSIIWDSFESMHLSNEYVLVGRAGYPMPRQLQKCLKIRGAGKQRLTINEPQLKSVKKRVVASFMQHAPGQLKDTIRPTLNAW